jgi:hypothetical protein
MKEALRQRIEAILDKAIQKRMFYKREIEQYASEKSYQSARNTEIKIDELSVFISELEKALK